MAPPSPPDFTFIRTEDDLKSVVRIGESREGLHLDVKRKKPEDHKVVKTLAAFANASGGYLVIGAFEDEEKRIAGFVPVNDPQSVVQQMNDAIDTQTRGFERRPEINIIEVDRKPVVVANVEASPRLVALWRSGEASRIQYPVRQDEQAIYLRPYDVEQRILGYLPRVRLLQISDLSRRVEGAHQEVVPCVVHCTSRIRSKNEVIPQQLQAELVEPTDWGIRLRILDAVSEGRQLPPFECMVPAEWVASVWLANGKGRRGTPQARGLALHLGLRAELKVNDYQQGFTPHLGA